MSDISDRSDTRIAWIRGRVLLGLKVNEGEFQYMLEDPNPSNSTAGNSSAANAAPCAADILREYLGTKAGVGSSLFFHVEMENVEESETYDEEYQESELVEGQDGPPGEATLLGEDQDDSIQGLTSNEVGPAPSGPAPSGANNTGDEADETAVEGSKVPNVMVADQADAESNSSRPETDQASAAVAEVRLVTKTRKAVRSVLTTKRRCRVTQGNLPDSSERVMYLVKVVAGEVARPTSSNDHGTMAAAMEYGCLAGDCLTNLSAVIKEVFTPLLDHQLGLGVLSAAIAGGGGDKGSSEAVANIPQVPQDAPKVGDNLRNEFRANLHKCESQVAHATQQVKGVHLSVPNINIDDPDIGNDFEAVSLLEGAMEEWSRLIATVVEAENLKRVKGKGPMAEIEFWRRRNASLSALYEQINMPKVTLYIYCSLYSYRRTRYIRTSSWSINSYLSDSIRSEAPLFPSW